MNPNTLTVNFLQLNASGLSMHKVVALNRYLQDTHSQIVALGETQRTFSNHEFANFDVLQRCNYCNKGRVSLLFGKLVVCEIRDRKTNEVDAI